MRNLIRGAGLALALITGASQLSACATESAVYKTEPLTQQEQARIQALSPLAELSSTRTTYVGQLPPNIAPTDSTKTNALGDITFLDTQSAVAQFGESHIRQHVAKDVRLCSRVELQKIYLGQLRRQSDSAQASQAKAYSREQNANTAGSVGMVGGAALAYGSFGPEYGAMYLVGSAFPGLAGQYGYRQMITQNDTNIALSLAQGRFWYNQNDLWLEAMDDWCPAFMGWVQQYGQLVPIDGAPAATAPRPTLPAAPPSGLPGTVRNSAPVNEKRPEASATGGPKQPNTPAPEATSAFAPAATTGSKSKADYLPKN